MHLVIYSFARLSSFIASPKRMVCTVLYNVAEPALRSLSSLLQNSTINIVYRWIVFKCIHR